MTRIFRSFSFWLAGTAVLLAFTLPARAFAHDASSGGASTQDIRGLFTITFWIAVPVFLLVEGLILFAILRYRRRRADDMPDQIEGNRRLEIGWTVLGFAIIGVLFVVTYHALRNDYTVKADNPDNLPDYTVHVSAYMWNWDYEYFVGDNQPTGVTTTKRLTIPADRAVYLEITSKDVQHSFWVPKLAGKVDAVPGHTNTMWLKVDKPGLYTGNCAEYCGTGHHDMLIEVEVLEPAAFETWLKDQTAAAGQFVPMGTDMQSAMPEGQADHGEQLFTQLGCSGCHGAQDGVGPALSRIRQDAQHHEGYTAEQYLRESILMPCAYTTPGFNCQIMPPDFGQKLDAQMLADLIAYLKESD
jgi:cytochrome c oxidase subunit 2